MSMMASMWSIKNEFDFDMMTLTRCYGFSAAHKLWNPDWDVAQNDKSFGACARLHGHTYRLEVTVSGMPSVETGMILDLRIMDALVNELILSHVDHQYLDEDVAFIQGKRSTVEVLSRLFFDRLAFGCKAYETIELYRVRLYESDDNWAETVRGGAK